MGVIDHLLRLANVLLEGLFRGVDHDIGVTGVGALLAVFDIGAVIQVQADRYGCRFGQRPVDGHQYILTVEFRGFDRGLDDQGGSSFNGRLNHGFHLNQAGDVEGADGIFAFSRLHHDFFSVDNRHCNLLESLC